jgi:hypothetical protein
VSGREEEYVQRERDLDLDRADVADDRDLVVEDDRGEPVSVGQSLPDGPGPVVAGGSPRGEPAVLGDKALVEASAGQEYRNRWADIQASFVDEPREAVTRADALVSEIIQEVADKFARERDSLESQWSRGDEVSTEDLRQAFRNYRAFLDRLLTT